MGVEWSGVAWRGVAWRGVEWSGVEWSGVEWSGVAWRGVAWSGVEWSGVEWSSWAPSPSPPSPPAPMLILINININPGSTFASQPAAKLIPRLGRLGVRARGPLEHLHLDPDAQDRHLPQSLSHGCPFRGNNYMPLADD